MKRSLSRLQRFGLLLLALCLVLGLLSHRPAQADTRLESRVTRLEFDLRSLRSEVSRLQSQVGSGPGASNPTSRPTTPPTPPSTAGYLDDPSLEEQFDNLATLVIELRQDVRSLTERVTALETP